MDNLKGKINNVNDVEFLINFWNNNLGVKSNYDLCISNMTSTMYRNTFANKILMPVIKAYDLYKEYQTLTVSEFKNILPPSFNGGEFSIGGIYNEIFNSSDFDIYNINTNNNDNNILQSLQILINDSPVRYLHNIITETTKNVANIDLSYDEKYISIVMEYYNIDDFHDINSITIPYYSLDNKFFLLYKQAYKLRLQLIYKEKYIEIEDNPIRVGDRVVDIIREMKVNELTDDLALSRIQIIIEANKYEAIEKLITLMGYIENELIHYNFMLNGREIDVVDDHRIIKTQIYSGLLIPQSNKSVITIFDDAFDDLDNFIENTGLQDLHKQHYETGINLKITYPKIIKYLQGDRYVLREMFEGLLILELSYILNELGIASLLKRQLENPNLNIVHNFRSTSDYHQILPSNYIISINEPNVSLHTFVMHCETRSITLGEAINLLNPEGKQIINQYVNQYILQTAYRWYSTKKLTVQLKNNDVVKNVVINEKLDKFTKAFIKSFWELGRTLLYYNKYFEEDIPELEWDYLKVRGYYSERKNLISININFQKNPHNIVFSSEGILNYIKNSGSELFNHIYPSSTVIHELTHAWNNTDEGPHNDIILYNKIEKINKIFTFEEAANYMYSNIMEKGLIDKILENLFKKD